ncbi:MAG: TniB family NTP-binding protein [Steroidobacteraceae bacterium]
MTLDLSHLTTATRELAFHDAKARVLMVQTARWVAYPRAGIAVEELERRFHYPTCARMPCMLLYGDSGMGKSMILEKMERQHPSCYDERKGITKRPVLIVQMPSSPDERRFYTRILEVLGAPYSVRDQIGALEGRVIHLLKQLGTQLLFIDEVHHLLAGSHREQRRALNLLKFLTNELKIVIVAVGTSDAFHALQTDVQVASRFEPLLIPRWTETDAFRAFVVAYGKLLPLRKSSPFGDPEMIRALIKQSAGITGRVTWLLGRAAEIAIQDGSEIIDSTAIERVSERLKLMAS